MIMTLREQYELLLKHRSQMILHAPASETEILSFDRSSGWTLPAPMKELLNLFDGGELFVPGTKVYGVSRNNRKSLSEVNSHKERSCFGIPANYIVFAKMNFGDLLCINSNAPYDVIQWDHELDEEFLHYDSLIEWLEEEITENEPRGDEEK